MVVSQEEVSCDISTALSPFSAIGPLHWKGLPLEPCLFNRTSSLLRSIPILRLFYLAVLELGAPLSSLLEGSYIQGRPSPIKPTMHIEFSPYFHTIYKSPPYFPCFRSI